MTCLSGIDHITFSSSDIQDQKAIVSIYIQVNPIKSTYFLWHSWGVSPLVTYNACLYVVTWRRETRWLVHLDIAPSGKLSVEMPFVFCVLESLAIDIQLSDLFVVLEIQAYTECREAGHRVRHCLYAAFCFALFVCRILLCTVCVSHIVLYCWWADVSLNSLFM